MKVTCKECNWRGLRSELLEAPSPFSSGFIRGCPKCLEVNSEREACDESDCWDEATRGTPVIHGSLVGYRRTCHKHIPK